MKRAIELIQYGWFIFYTIGLFMMAIDGDIIDIWSLIAWIMQLLVIYYIYTFGAKK